MKGNFLKLNSENYKIYNYIENDKLLVDKLVLDYTNYINAILDNSYINLSVEDKEEIKLDTFLTVWQNMNKLDINKNMSPYIAGIANNLIKKKLRSKNENFNIEDFENDLKIETDIEINYLKSDINKKILNELDKFKNDDKEIFLSYYYDFRKIKEISKIFNLSESKVKSKLFRMRKKMKKILEKEDMI